MCDSDWYEGYPGHVPDALRHNGTKHEEFTSGDAVAVRFDDAIENYCKSIVEKEGLDKKPAKGKGGKGRRLQTVNDTSIMTRAARGRRLQAYARECVLASRNILLLFGDNVHNTGAGYNSCRNFEWQMCAARGKLPGQRSPTLIFARAPGTLDTNGDRKLDQCGGYQPEGCWSGTYANDDIFFLGDLCL